jgi:predicted AlkP superfamily phosphohydrolase/phosphomutase
VAHALWNIASDAGLRVAVVNWWNSFPPEKINGVMVTDYALPGVWRDRKLAWKSREEADGTPRVYPPEWQERASAVIAEDRLPVSFANPFEDPDPFPHWVKTEKLSNAFLDDARVTRLALMIERDQHPEVLMLLLFGIDRVSHWLWGSLEPASAYPEHLRPSPAERDAGRAALLAYYVYTDALLGELLARYGPDDLVVVLSDHGFEAGVLFKHLTGTHESEQAVDGVFYARGPGLPAGEAAEGAGEFLSVNDVTPTILAWLGLPIAEDMQGRPMPAAVRGPLRTLPSYDTTPVERLGGEDRETEAEILDQLQELGYIE